MIKHLRTLLLLLLTGLGATAGRGQTFTFNTAGAIPDTTVNLCFPIGVQGLPDSTSMHYGLTGVCLNITHTYDSDLEVWLTAPTGQAVQLFNRIGGGGDNFTDACFAEDATRRIENDTAPFTGVFLPQGGDLNAFNDSLNPNGVWRLCVTDHAAEDFGILNTFSLTFGPNVPPSPPPPPTPCGFDHMLACNCPDGSDTCDLLPDMKASGSIMAQQHTETAGLLRISNATPNIGYGPLEVHGAGNCLCDSVPWPCDSACPGSLKEKVVQTIYHKMRDTFTTWTREAGYMAYHPSHGHVHVERWSQFTLRNRTSDPNPLHWPIVATGQKVSFCLINLYECRTANGFCLADNGRVLDRDSMPNAGLGRVTGCQRDQGIYPGNADVYDQTLDGQSIDLTSVCNGSYYLVSQTDPENLFMETNDSNNVAYTPITLTRQTPPTAPPIVLQQLSTNQVRVRAVIPAGLAYVWDFGDGVRDSSAMAVIHTYATPGRYVIKLIVRYFCGNSTALHAVDITVLATQLKQSDLRLTAEPNPAEGSAFVVRFQKPTEAPATLRLTDLTGREVAAYTLRTGAGQTEQPIDLPGLQAGLYLVRLTTEVGSAAIRVIVR